MMNSTKEQSLLDAARAGVDDSAEGVLLKTFQHPLVRAQFTAGTAAAGAGSNKPAPSLCLMTFHSSVSRPSSPACRRHLLRPARVASI